MAAPHRTYYKNLDTLRFIAAFFVVISHWFTGRLDFFPFAKIGVDVFFVLSGFLITEILLNYKKDIGSGASTIGNALKKFYIRRSLRIFPVYYLFITFFFIINVPPLKSGWFFLYTYTTNFYMYHLKDWIYPLGHLWSLAVEEQFYLLWPFLILFINRKYLPALIIIAIVGSLVCNSVMINKSEFFFVLPFSCVGTLGFGALLAVVKQYDLYYSVLKAKASLLTLLSLALLLACIYFNTAYLFKHLLISVFAFSLICYSINSKNKVYNWLFSNRITSYLGKISYGIYLFHRPIPWIVRNLNGTETQTNIGFPHILPVFGRWYSIFLEHFIFLIVLCSLSWFLFEKPILRLKDISGRPKPQFSA